jgi:hypothetical protein
VSCIGRPGDPGEHSLEDQQHLLLPWRKWLCSHTWLILNEIDTTISEIYSKKKKKKKKKKGKKEKKPDQIRELKIKKSMVIAK